jgi:hypothetical protein
MTLNGFEIPVAFKPHRVKAHSNKIRNQKKDNNNAPTNTTTQLSFILYISDSQPWVRETLRGYSKKKV